MSEAVTDAETLVAEGRRWNTEVRTYEKFTEVGRS